MSWVGEIIINNNTNLENNMKPNKDKVNSFNLMSITVTRILDELGSGLWGPNKFMAKNYLIRIKKCSWSLLNIEYINAFSSRYRILNRLEVSVNQNNYFRIEHTYSRICTAIPVVCDDLSDESLKKGLINICSKMTFNKVIINQDNIYPRYSFLAFMQCILNLSFLRYLISWGEYKSPCRQALLHKDNG